MKLLIEFNLQPTDKAHDISQICVDIKERVHALLMARQLSWDEVRVSELHGQRKYPDEAARRACPKTRRKVR